MQIDDQLLGPFILVHLLQLNLYLSYLQFVVDRVEVYLGGLWFQSNLGLLWNCVLLGYRLLLHQKIRKR